MESLRISLNAVLPLFIYMALGFLARRFGMIGEKEVFRFNRLAFYFFLTASVFHAVYKSDLSSALRPGLILYGVAGVLATFFAGLLIFRRTVRERDRRGVMVQGIFRSNLVLIGLAIAQALVPDGDVATVAVLSAFIIPLYNVLAVVILSYYGGERPSFREMLRKIAKNPLILAIAAGFVFLLSGIRLPAPVERAISGMGSAATPLMLFLQGGFFRFESLGKYAKELTVAALFRLVLAPGVLLTLGYLLGFRGMEFAGLIGAFASSAAVSSFTMTQQIGGDAELAGGIVIVTSLFSILTLFGWCTLFSSLGAF